MNQFASDWFRFIWGVLVFFALVSLAPSRGSIYRAKHLITRTMHAATAIP
jgi:hypothetical protein